MMIELEKTSEFKQLWGLLKNTYQMKLERKPERQHKWFTVRELSKQLLAVCFIKSFCYFYYVFTYY